jgi:hypothetical protein
MNEGQVYRCQNIKCRGEVKVVKSSVDARANPRCCCGSEMKKPYTAPVLRELTSDMKVFVSDTAR